MKKKGAILGGGTAGLFLAAFLNTDIYDITIFYQDISGDQCRPQQYRPLGGSWKRFSRHIHYAPV